MNPDFLAIDIGNTHMTLGLMRELEVVHSFKLSSKKSAADLLPDFRAGVTAFPSSAGGAYRGDAQPIQAAIASVNPPATAVAEKLVHDVLGVKAIVLGRDRLFPVENRAARPEQVGADRLINALAAWHFVKGSAIVVDFGTAITFDVVSADGAYLGGAIAPGIMLAMKALHDNTALIPLVRPEPDPPALGRDTVSAVNAGVYHGYVGLARNILEELFKEFPKRPRVISTGGDGNYIAPRIGLIDDVMPHLTLQGIRLAHDAPR